MKEYIEVLSKLIIENPDEFILAVFIILGLLLIVGSFLYTLFFDR